ncbi:hypothetical protein RND71_025650 [Anisodus tanguticus]|uniref:NB-ARC domain-containing protein n=1 Tax=Anisodus tanguticus TaxID=243964 RepID=A0AAE1VCU4_9SOLA|nr:hypothetical protein RND71_025650 [Anisodus tanguticus]
MLLTSSPDPGQNSGGSVVGDLEQCDENLNEEHNINTDTNHTSENDTNEEINHMSELTEFKMISTRKLSMKFYSQMGPQFIFYQGPTKCQDRRPDEDMTELELRELTLSQIEESQGRTICKCLHQVIENVNSVKEEWMKMKNIYGNINDQKQRTFDHGDSSSQHVLESKNIMVGYDDELEMLKDQLVRGLGEMKVISLVGMGGIGKTTFLTRVFNEPVIMSHFDVRAKITVSQEYHVRNLYLDLLHYTSSRSEELEEKNDGALADLLQKSLKGRSRILLTTRNTEVAEYASLGTPPIQMRLLTFDECWNLLYQKVFENEHLSPEFEKIGKEISRKCQGLPLATVVMAGVLLKIGKSLDEWKKVVEDVNLLMSKDPDHYCSRVLALSYYHLPCHLRACLLYLVAFKKSNEIPVGKLVRLWAAEGLVKVKRGEYLEMAAEKCLKDLIDRSLVSVHTWSSRGKIKSCRIHDMVCGFCLEEAQVTNFLNIITENNVQRQGSHSQQRRIQSSWMDYQLYFDDDTGSKVRSIIYYGSVSYAKRPKFSSFKLLRVLDLISVRPLMFKPIGIEGLFFLRYLALFRNEHAHIRVIAKLRNLQSLIIHRRHTSQRIYLPIWGLSQLSHLKSSLILLGNPPPEYKSLVFERLHTLSGLNPAGCTPSVLEGILNVKRLKICGDKDHYILSQLGSFEYCDLSHLHQLESLSVVALKKMEFLLSENATLRLPPACGFPQNLKKLTLERTFLPWDEMVTTFSQLPKLEALKLIKFACLGTEWETIEDGFPQLKLLLLDWTDLALWKTSSGHFPCLERLVLRHCHSLVSMPENFAYIMTLQLIELDVCRPSVVASAKEIQEEVGDNVLDVHVGNTI